MNRILYITYVDYCKKAFPGVEAKIAGQIKTMQGASYHVDRINQYENAAQLVNTETGESELFRHPILRRFSILRAVKAAVSRHAYTAAYIRFQFFSEDVRQITALLKKKGVKVLMEFPTFPYEGELHQQGPKGEVKLFCDRLFRKVCCKHIDAFVTQAEEPEIYGVPCIRVLNGLDYSKYPLRSVRPAQPGQLHMLAVASMLPWHGYDRVLNGLADYYRTDSKEKMNIIFHLVGEGKEISKYKEIVDTNSLADHVVFHGMQGGDALLEIASACDIAVGSLAAFRIGLKKMSTLKSREYCAWGFPSVNATETDILDENDPFCLFVPEDESPVRMEEIAAFYNRVYFESQLSAEEIARSIRNAAESCSDVSAVFRPVLDFIEVGAVK